MGSPLELLTRLRFVSVFVLPVEDGFRTKGSDAERGPKVGDT